MKTNIEQLPKSRIKCEIELTAPELEKYINKAFSELAPGVQIKGFRPGKAPKERIISELGEEKLTHKALDMALPETLANALKDKELVAVSTPAISIKSVNNGLAYEAELDIWPKVIVGDYKKLKIKLPPEEEVKTTEVDEVIKHLQKQKAKMTKIDRPAEKGDLIEMDFEGKINGVVKEKLVSRHHPIILGETTLIPGFEDNLLKLKTGDEKTFKLMIPKDHPDKEMAGQDVEFKVNVHQVQKVELPLVDDALAKEFGQKNINDLKEAITKSIGNEKETKRQQMIDAMVVDKVLGVTQTDIPDSMTEHELERILGQITEEAKSYGMSLDQYLLKLKKTQEELRKEWREQAEKNVKVGLMLGEVAKKEGYKTDAKDLPRQIIKKLTQDLTK